MAFTFDGTNKLIVLSSGTVGVVLADLYSRYKDWLLAGNAGFLPAFETVGGEPIDAAAGTLVPLYLFLKNGWRIRPQEATHTLKVTDGVLVVAGGGDPFVNTLGNYSVRVNFSQPVQAFGYSTSGGSGVSAGDIADGLAIYPLPAAVLAGISYGPTGVEYTGTLALSAAAIATQVRTELAVELLRITEVAKIHGLVQGVNLVVTPTSRTAGDIAQTISGDGVSSSIVSRV